MSIKGKFIAKAMEWTLGVSDTGKEHIAVEFAIQEGEHSGSRLTWRGYFTEKTSERTIESLRYCGWKCDSLLELTGMGSNAVTIVAEPEEYNGKTYDRIQWVNKLGGLAVKNKMDDKARAAFAARMKGAAMSVPKDLADGPAYEKPASNGASDDDGDPGFDEGSIPF